MPLPEPAIARSYIHIYTQQITAPKQPIGPALVAKESKFEEYMKDGGKVCKHMYIPPILKIPRCYFANVDENLVSKHCSTSTFHISK
jgi:hypothetical protein